MMARMYRATRLKCDFHLNTNICCGNHLTASHLKAVKYIHNKWMPRLLTSNARHIQYGRYEQHSRALSTQSVQYYSSNNIPYIPTKGHLVYDGTLTQAVKAIKIFSLSTSFMAIGAQPLILSYAKDDLMFKAGLLGAFSFLFFLTPLTVHHVTRRYVTDIYFDEKTKVFTLGTKSFFLQRKELKYKASDVEIPLREKMFATHRIKGSLYYINLEEFISKEIYKHMVGFDKPMDWQIRAAEQIANNQKDRKEKKTFGLFDDSTHKSNEVERNKQDGNRDIGKDMNAFKQGSDISEQKKQLYKRKQIIAEKKKQLDQETEDDLYR